MAQDKIHKKDRTSKDQYLEEWEESLRDRGIIQAEVCEARGRVDCTCDPKYHRLVEGRKLKAVV